MTTTIENLANYRDRFDEDDNFEKVLMIAGNAGQSSEHNEMQSIALNKMKNGFDALFSDGDIVKDCSIVTSTDSVFCEAGQIYCDGGVRNILSATLTPPMVGTAYIGVYLMSSVITALDEPDLYNKEVGSPAEGQEGAARLKMWLEWGWKTDTDNDGHDGEFYAVYTLDSGVQRLTDSPPTLSTTNTAIATYDVDSAGGYYVCSGMSVSQDSDLSTGEQVYTVAEGRARVAGYSIELTTSRRITYDASPDLFVVESEPHAATGDAAQVITLDRTPIDSIQRVKIVVEKTVTMAHGGYSGCSDLLPDSSVLRILSVSQGETTYTVNTDYFLNAGSVDWSPTSDDSLEPATGSTYSVTYQYNTLVALDAFDETSVTVTGAVADSIIEVSYTAKLSRIDRLCLDADGAFSFVKGVASYYTPVSPTVPNNMLALATIYQNWDSSRYTLFDAVATVPMNTLSTMQSQIYTLQTDVARLTLVTDVNTRENSEKFGIFTDTFADDSQRDQGIEQTGAIYDDMLTLPVESVEIFTLEGLDEHVTLPFTFETCLEQPLITGSRLVNPYQSFDPIPAVVTLNPAYDRWTETQTVWTSSVTNKVTTGSGTASTSSSSTSTNTVSSVTSNITYLRQISVKYTVTGMAYNEDLVSLTFDGIELTIADGTKSNSSGVLTGTFTIPSGVLAGSKTVAFTGAGGSYGEAVFVGQGTLTVTTLQSVTTVTTTYYDPLAQTFTLESATPLAGVELFFTAVGDSATTVQIRNTSNGYPSTTILASARLEVADIIADGVTATRAVFDTPIMLTAYSEYAIVVLTDDAETAVAVAEVGKSTNDGQWVTSQPYTIGVLLSSSNASTWTAHQTEDLTFRLLKAVYEPTTLSVELGTMSFDGITDALFLCLVDRPAASTLVDFSLNYVNSLDETVTVPISEEQPLNLGTELTADITVVANLTGTADAAPTVYKDSQMVVAITGSTGDYVSTAIYASETVSIVKVIADVYLPSGSSIAVSCAPTYEDFVSMGAPSSTTELGDGWVETQWMIDEYDETSVRCKLVLSGSASARPYVKNLRMLTTD